MRLLRFTKKQIREDARKYWQAFFFVAILVIWFSLIFVITPSEVVEIIGIDGAYLLLFLTAIVGASALSSAPFYTFLLAFASTGEFNPVIIGLVGGAGLVTGDYIFYYLGLKSRPYLLKKKFIANFSNWVAGLPGWLTPIVAFLYSVIAPLPQDLLMLAMGLAQVSFAKIVVPLVLGTGVSIGLMAYFISIAPALP